MTRILIDHRISLKQVQTDINMSAASALATNKNI